MVRGVSCGGDKGSKGLSRVLCGALWCVPTKGVTEDECKDNDDGGENNERIRVISSWGNQKCYMWMLWERCLPRRRPGRDQHQSHLRLNHRKSGS